MKSLTRIRSFGPSVRNAEISSGSVYSLTVNECIGPRPLANQRTRTFRISDRETIFSADKCGHLSLNHFLMTCGETPTFLANTSVSVTPAANIAAFSLAPNVDMNSPSVNKTAEVESTQDTENKVSHFLSFIKFCFAAASPLRASSLSSGCSPRSGACPMAGGFFDFRHTHSFHFFGKEGTCITTCDTGNAIHVGGSHE